MVAKETSKKKECQEGADRFYMEAVQKRCRLLDNCQRMCKNGPTVSKGKRIRVISQEEATVRVSPGGNKFLLERKPRICETWNGVL